MRHEGRKVFRIRCGQFRASEDGGGGDHGVETITSLAAGLVIELAGEIGGRLIKGINTA